MNFNTFRRGGLFDPIMFDSGRALAQSTGGFFEGFGKPIMSASNPADLKIMADKALSRGDVQGAAQAMSMMEVILGQNAAKNEATRNSKLTNANLYHAENDAMLEQLQQQQGQRAVVGKLAGFLDKDLLQQVQSGAMAPGEAVKEQNTRRQKVLEEQNKRKIEEMKQAGMDRRERMKYGADEAKRATDLKAQEEVERQKMRSDIVSLDEMMSSIDRVEELLPEVGEWEYATMSFLPGTDALALKDALTPLKSSMAFDRLQKMRDESKTGGALGQVSNIELKLLEQSLTALNPANKDFPEQVKKVRQHYENVRKAMLGESPDIDWGYYEEKGYAVEMDGKRYMVDPVTNDWYEF